MNKALWLSGDLEPATFLGKCQVVESGSHWRCNGADIFFFETWISKFIGKDTSMDNAQRIAALNAADDLVFNSAVNTGIQAVAMGGDAAYVTHRLDLPCDYVAFYRNSASKVKRADAGERGAMENAAPFGPEDQIEPEELTQLLGSKPRPIGLAHARRGDSPRARTDKTHKEEDVNE